MPPPPIPSNIIGVKIEALVSNKLCYWQTTIVGLDSEPMAIIVLIQLCDCFNISITQSESMQKKRSNMGLIFVRMWKGPHVCC